MNRDLVNTLDVLNNLNYEKMERKSKSILSNMEQNKLSKLMNDETVIIKHADEGELQ